eukprot:TRINITY_DN7803_c0_g1_i1.p2 TRINITY_DN7803_c0_g1~~TRINITY_DN7803_c0_g1_i1.p2  ORF type:complete len:126 (+),score=45.05 TRINITY_DN7803_c0_g1_i1:46-423(+)
MGKIVQEGVFDPREYKQNDPHWARKRKPEYMGPGKIYYTREFNEDERAEDRFARRDLVAEYRASKSKSATPEPREPEPVLEPEEEYLEIPIQQEPAPAARPSPPAHKKPDLWPKRVRSDITVMFR